MQRFKKKPRLGLVLSASLIGFLVVLLSIFYVNGSRLLNIFEQEKETHAQSRLDRLLADIKSSDPVGAEIAVTQLQQAPHLLAMGKKTLLRLAKSSHFFAAKNALHCLMNLEGVDSLEIVKVFWQLCLTAAETDYPYDPALREIFIGMTSHLADAMEQALIDAVNNRVDVLSPATVEEIRQRFDLPEWWEDSLPLETDDEPPSQKVADQEDSLAGSYDDLDKCWNCSHLSRIMDAFIVSSNWHFDVDQEMAQAYIDAYSIFEVITYFTMTVYDRVAPSGVYSRYDPAVLNAYISLYRFTNQLFHFPNFYKGSEWNMYTSINYLGFETYQSIWQGLMIRDPLLGEYNDISSFLWQINNKGVRDIPPQLMIVVKDQELAGTLEKTTLNLLKRYLRLPVQLMDVDSVLTTWQKFSDDALDMGEQRNIWIKRHLLVTLDKMAFSNVTARFSDATDEWDHFDGYLHLLPLLPVGKKLKSVTKKKVLTILPVAHYDPKDPFAPDTDILAYIQKAFEQSVLGLKHVDDED